MFKPTIFKRLFALVMMAALAACGGGTSGDNAGAVGNGTAPSGSSGIPASAFASTGGMVAFMDQLIDAGADDAGEPILLGDAGLPADDTI